MFQNVLTATKSLENVLTVRKCLEKGLDVELRKWRHSLLHPSAHPSCITMARITKPTRTQCRRFDPRGDLMQQQQRFLDRQVEDGRRRRLLRFLYAEEVRRVERHAAEYPAGPTAYGEQDFYEWLPRLRPPLVVRDVRRRRRLSAFRPQRRALPPLPSQPARAARAIRLVLTLHNQRHVLCAVPQWKGHPCTQPRRSMGLLIWVVQSVNIFPFKAFPNKTLERHDFFVL